MKGFKIELGENAENMQEYVVQPVKVEKLPEALKLVAQLEELDKEDENSDAQFTDQERLKKRVDLGMDLFTLIMSRNYPDKTRSDWEKIVDIADVFHVITKVWSNITGAE